MIIGLFLCNQKISVYQVNLLLPVLLVSVDRVLFKSLTDVTIAVIVELIAFMDSKTIEIYLEIPL